MCRWMKGPMRWNSSTATVTERSETCSPALSAATTSRARSSRRPSRALRERRSFRGEGSLDAWVWKIAVNTALKRRRVLVREEELEAEPAAGAAPSADPSIREAVLALLPRRRLVIFLRYFADLSYREIAEIVGISEGTVAATLSQAHRELARRLEPEEVRR
jgi:RNA polymerase sigma-70 factor (ECF subfamily)